MTDRHERSAGLEELGLRLDAMEQIVAAMAEEVSTRRLQVIDGDGRARITAEVVGDTAELRVEVPGRERVGDTHVVAFATPGRSADMSGEPEPSAGVAVQVDGNVVASLDYST